MQFANAMICYCDNNVASNTHEDFLKKVGNLTDHIERKHIINDAKVFNQIEDDVFDTNPYLFNCKNGTYDFKTFTFKPHCQEDFITQMSNVTFNPSCQSVVLDNFMKSVFDNDYELVKYVYSIIGYALTGLNYQECMYFCLGETSRNGKSTFLDMISYMMGNTKGYSRSCDIATFASSKQNGKSANPDIYRLKNSRFVTASEPTERFQFDESLIKTITGSDTLVARALYRSFEEFKPSFKIFIATNHLPIFIDEVMFISKRIRIIPFNVHFPDDLQDKNLKEKLKADEVITALFNNAINAYKDLVDNGEKLPKSVNEMLTRFKTKEELYQEFLKEQLIEDKNSVTPTNVFYDLYKSWCIENNYKYLTKQEQHIYLKKLGKFCPYCTYEGKTVKNAIIGYCMPSNYVLKEEANYVSNNTTVCEVKEIYNNNIMIEHDFF